MYSAEQQRMESSGDRGQPSYGIYDAGSQSESEMSEAPHHDVLAMITPRKRLVLNIDPKCKRISTTFSIQNRSHEPIAFKGQCGADDGYVFDPDRGILDPGMKVTVQLVLDDSFDALRELEDSCTVFISPYVEIKYPCLEDFFISSFDQQERLEKYSIQLDISLDVKDRLAQLADEQFEIRKKEEDDRRFKRFVYPTVGALFGFIGLYILFVDFCTPYCDDPVTSKHPSRSLP